MIFYFSGTTSGADPERFKPEAAIMMSFMLTYDKNKKRVKLKKTFAPDPRFNEVYQARKEEPSE